MTDKIFNPRILHLSPTKLSKVVSLDILIWLDDSYNVHLFGKYLAESWYVQSERQQLGKCVQLQDEHLVCILSILENPKSLGKLEDIRT